MNSLIADTETMAQALRSAARSGKLQDASRALSNPNLVVDEPDHCGTTALTVAVRNGHTQLVKLLLERGADVNRVSNDGISPLVDAAVNFHIDIVQMLIRKKANVEAALKQLESASQQKKGSISAIECRNAAALIKQVCEEGSIVVNAAIDDPVTPKQAAQPQSPSIHQGWYISWDNSSC
jgi:ankyrin repeat protein